MGASMGLSMGGPLSQEMVIAGAGMGGLSTSIAMGLEGFSTTLIERRNVFAELGAGIQLGPNSTRILDRWGLMQSLETYAAWPKQIEVFRFDQTSALAKLDLGPNFKSRYGAPYVTIHRADFQASLYKRMLAIGQTDFRMGSTLVHLNNQNDGVGIELRTQLLPAEQSPLCSIALRTTTEEPGTTKTTHLFATALIGADGVSSEVRRLQWPHRRINATPHLAYRATVPQKLLPLKLRQDGVRVFLGPQMHCVLYPVRCGEWLNIVALMEAPFDAEHASDALQTPLQQVWTEKVSLDARREHFRLALKGASSDLQELFKAVGEWSAWRLFDANPLSSADQMVQGRVALLGDAAHPMLPFLAQGAGMSIEDAERLTKAWSNQDQSPVQRLQTYGQNRWLRNARVQRRARSNATVFHATGMMAGLRDLGLAVLGERLLDMPWLYGYR